MTATDALTVLRELLKRADGIVQSATNDSRHDAARGARAVRHYIVDAIARLEREQAEADPQSEALRRRPDQEPR